MGAKVQCKNYQHGFHSMRDLNEVNNSWPLYYEDEALSRQFHNATKQKFINGYTEYDMEALRQTILTHEATFRKQVHELHRLYSVQRKLMDQLKTKEQCGYSLGEQAVLRSPFSSQMPQKDVAKEFTWSTSLPSLNAGFGTPFPNGDDNGSLTLAERIDALNNSEPSKSQSRKSVKIVIDKKDAENTKKDYANRSKRLLDLNDDPEPENVLKIMHANGECPKSRKMDLQLKNDTEFNGFVDLNEPVEEVHYEDGVSSLCNLPDPRSLHEKTQHHMSLRSDSTLLNQQGLFKNNGCQISCSSFLHVNEKEDILGWQLSRSRFEHFQMGKSICSPHTFSSTIMSSSSDKLKMHNELSWPPLSSPNNLSSRLKDKLPMGNEHGKPFTSTKSRISGPVSESFSIIPRFDSCNMASTSESSCRKSVNKASNIPNAVQTLPCFNNSVPCHEGSTSAHDTWKYSGSLRSQQSSGNEASYKNGFPCDLQFGSRTPCNLHSPKVGFGMSNISNGASFYHGKFEDDAIQKHYKGFNLMDVISSKDVASKPLSTIGSQHGCANQKSYFDNSNGSASGVSWLRSTQVCNGSINLNGAVEYDPGVELNYSQTMSNNAVVSVGKEAANYSFKDVLQSMNKKNEVSAILKDTGHSGLSSIDLNLNCTQATTSMAYEENSTNMIPIDVNTAAESMDQPALLGSVDNEQMSQSKLAVTTVSGRAVSEIDLEAPIISHSEENMFSEEALQINNQFSTFEDLSRQKEIGNEYKELYVETARAAAETIMSMSRITQGRSSNSITFQTSGLASVDTLYWFADIITSNVEDPQSAAGALKGQRDEDGSSEHNGMDYFESMTLRLTETKPEDFWSQPPIPEHQEEGPGVASLLLPKIKRGQVRRRRQKRDFQKDILPGLATLSRYEVTEDLQTIGGLMRASGQSWQMGSRKRSSGRSGRSFQGRRWQQGGMTTVEIPADSPPLQQSNNELENDGCSVLGWGRTRRCRRQRCPSGNITIHPPLT